MSPAQQREALIQYLKVQVELCNWKQVRRLAKQLRQLEDNPFSASAPIVKAEPLKDIMPREAPIPHNVQEVMNILKMSDEDLVEKLFPLPQPEQAQAAEG